VADVKLPAVKILELDRRRWVVLPEEDYLRLVDRVCEQGGPGWEMLPAMDSHEHLDAVDWARASLARKIIRRRRAAGLTQVELSRRAGVRPETLNRVEKGRTTPSVATIAKLERALESARAEAREEDEAEGEAEGQ
jgi:DNA-binding XRE family transcriptional regulator